MKLRTISEAIKKDELEYKNIKISGGRDGSNQTVKAIKFSNRAEAEKWILKNPGHKIVQGGRTSYMTGFDPARSSVCYVTHDSELKSDKKRAKQEQAEQKQEQRKQEKIKELMASEKHRDKAALWAMNHPDYKL